MIGKNELLVEVLSVMEPLVSYGFFWDPNEITKIIEILIKILDGKSDKPAVGMKYILVDIHSASNIDATGNQDAAHQKLAHYNSNENNKKLFRVKAKYYYTSKCNLFFMHVELLKYFIYSLNNTVIQQTQ